MAMFDYFPNYVWNLSVSIAMASGAELGEIMDMCQPLRAKAQAGEDAGTGDFLREWMRVADKLVDLAAEDTATGHLFAAGPKLQRAALYYFTAERMQGHGHPGRMETYDKALAAFAKGTAYCRDNVQRVMVPYGDQMLPALFTRAQGVTGPAPTVLYLNGLDSCKELLYWSRLPMRWRNGGFRRCALTNLARGNPCANWVCLRIMTAKNGARPPMIIWQGAPMSMPRASGSRAFRWAAITRRAFARTSRVSHRAPCGAPTTIGPKSSKSASSAKAKTPCRITGRMCNGCLAPKTAMISLPAPLA